MPCSMSSRSSRRYRGRGAGRGIRSAFTGESVGQIRGDAARRGGNRYRVRGGSCDFVYAHADDPECQQSRTVRSLHAFLRGGIGDDIHYLRGAAFGNEHEPGAHVRFGFLSVTSGLRCGSSSLRRSLRCTLRGQFIGARDAWCIAQNCTITMECGASSIALSANWRKRSGRNKRPTVDIVVGTASPFCFNSALAIAISLR